MPQDAGARRSRAGGGQVAWHWREHREQSGGQLLTNAWSPSPPQESGGRCAARTELPSPGRQGGPYRSSPRPGRAQRAHAVARPIDTQGRCPVIPNCVLLSEYDENRMNSWGRDLPTNTERAGKPPSGRVSGTSTRELAATVTTAACARRRRTRTDWPDKTRATGRWSGPGRSADAGAGRSARYPTTPTGHVNRFTAPEAD